MKKNILLFVTGLAAMSWAHADEVGSWYITSQVGSFHTDHDRGIDDNDRLYGLGIGKHLTRNWSIELNANASKLEGIAPSAASLDLLRVFRRDERLSPYFTFGAGALRNDFDPADEGTDPILQAGAGLLWELGQNRGGTSVFSLRPEIKARWDDAGNGGHFIDYIATLGFQFSFGSAPAIAAPPPPEPLPPESSQPVTVPPADTDGDAVVDDDDRCPGTSSGVAVDDTGCPRRGSITLAGIAFETNSAMLTRESLPALDRVAANLRKHPRFEIELQGHTDETGTDRYNLHLSQQRANSVRDHLLSQGVSPSQVVARGYGEREPVGDNTTAEGRAKNRRVVMVVLQNPGNLTIKAESESPLFRR